MATVWKKLIFRPIFVNFLNFFENRGIHTEGPYQKFQVNRLKKVVLRKTRLNFFFFYTKFFL